jgi:hypothetical protein
VRRCQWIGQEGVRGERREEEEEHLAVEAYYPVAQNVVDC